MCLSPEETDTDTGRTGKGSSWRAGLNPGPSCDNAKSLHHLIINTAWQKSALLDSSSLCHVTDVPQHPQSSRDFWHNWWHFWVTHGLVKHITVLYSAHKQTYLFTFNLRRISVASFFLGVSTGTEGTEEGASVSALFWGPELGLCGSWEARGLLHWSQYTRTYNSDYKWLHTSSFYFGIFFQLEQNTKHVQSC